MSSRMMTNPDPMALLLAEVKADRCLLYLRRPANLLRGAEGIIATWRDSYVRFASVQGKYSQLRALGPLTKPPNSDRTTIDKVPPHMRHALAGWIHMRHHELKDAESWKQIYERVAKEES